jgi:membrane associated rhomboid family serine protease
MARSNPITMTFPPFAGTVRMLILANVTVFFAVAILQWLAPALAHTLVALCLLHPASVARAEIWQLFTYSFVHFGIFDILFAMLTLWFCGSMLEGAYGHRWLSELYFASVIGGALVATALSFTKLLTLSPDTAIGGGAWAGVFGLLVAIGLRFGDQEFLLFPLPISIRAKYLVAIYILIEVAVLLKASDAFNALLQLSGGFCGFLYVRYAPRRGMALGFTERYFGLRNAYYRAKRRRAARKFEVYMGKQGRQVKFDEEGRYIDPDSTPKDPNDKRWMN